MRTPLGLTLAFVLLVACAGTAATSPDTGDSSGSTSTPPPPPTSSAGVVAGVALDTRGEPIARATVWLEPALTTGLAKTRTSDDGRYTVSGLINVPYYAKAWTEVTYHGQDYCVRLSMPNASDYDAFVPTAGAVRNFRWQLDGPIPDLRGRFFGGEVRLFAYSSFATGDSVELRLVPTGPLIDGSAGQVVTRTVVPNEIVQGIPHGVYTATATLVGADGKRTVLRVGRSSTTLTESASLDWTPSGTTCGNDSGLGRSFLYWDRP